MEAESQLPKGREGAILVLNAEIGALNNAEKISSIVPVKVVLGSVRTLLTVISVCFLLFCYDLLHVHAS